MQEDKNVESFIEEKSNWLNGLKENVIINFNLDDERW